MVQTPEGAKISNSLVVEPDFTWKVYVYGKEVPQFCSILRICDKKLNTSSLNKLLTVIDESKVCVGHPEERFVSLIKARKGQIKRADGTVSAYLDTAIPVYFDEEAHSETVRSTSCELLVTCNKFKLRCQGCIEYRRNLRALHGKWQCSPSRKIKRAATDSHANYRYLDTPEKKERLTKLHSENRALNRQVAQLQNRIEKLTNQNGILLDHNMDADMRTIVSENNDNICSSFPPQSFGHIFWKQQRDCMLAKNSKQMRWHPMMIKWCMHLQMLSSSCYDSIRSAGVIKLPSERTLRDYRNVIKARSGLQPDVDKLLYEEANVDEAPDHQKYVTLIFDEVKIKEDIVYNKFSGEMIGFVDITNINQHLLDFEQSCLSDTYIPNHQLATHVLVFMVRGIFSQLEFPYAQFPVAAASGEVLFPIVWSCIERLEMIGLKVLALVCDAAAPNRKLFKLHSTTNELTYEVKNIYAAEKDRPLFLISDVPHLLKTSRNCWANSHAHINSRKLWVSIYMYI